MSKLTVFLCIMLFASVANATIFRDTLQRIHDRIGTRIDATILRVRERFESIQQNAQSVAEKIIQDGAQVAERIRNGINNELEKIETEVTKLTGWANGADVTECTKLAAHVDDVALAVMENVTMCINGKLEAAVGYVEAITNITADVMSNLTNIREEAFLCGADVNDLPSALSAVVCAKRAAARATWVAAKVVPVITVKITRLSFVLATIPPTLAYCTAKNGMIAVSNESSVVLGKIKKCIRAKIEGIHATTPKIDSTTTVSSLEITYTPEELTSEEDFTIL